MGRHSLKQKAKKEQLSSRSGSGSGQMMSCVASRPRRLRRKQARALRRKQAHA
jgi:hypothetical protein